jgi:hypothetical protein
MTTSPLSVAFMGKLVFENVALLPIFAEHLEDNEGEILPHVLMAFFAAEFLVGFSENSWQVKFLRTLESCLKESEDSAIEGVVALSFIENLPSSGEMYAEILNCSGSKMRELFLEMNGRT